MLEASLVSHAYLNVIVRAQAFSDACICYAPLDSHSPVHGWWGWYPRLRLNIWFLGPLLGLNLILVDAIWGGGCAWGGGSCRLSVDYVVSQSVGWS